MDLMLSDCGLFCLAVGNFCCFVGPLTFAIAPDSLARDTVCNRELFTAIILRMLMSTSARIDSKQLFEHSTAQAPTSESE